MFNKNTLRYLKIAAARNVHMKRKILLIVGAGALMSMLMISAIAWGGFQLAKGASSQFKQAGSVVGSIDMNACLAAVSEISTPGYWLDMTIEKNFAETLARCKSLPVNPCYGDACLDTGSRKLEVET